MVFIKLKSVIFLPTTNRRNRFQFYGNDKTTKKFTWTNFKYF